MTELSEQEELYLRLKYGNDSLGYWITTEGRPIIGPYKSFKDASIESKYYEWYDASLFDITFGMVDHSYRFSKIER